MVRMEAVVWLRQRLQAVRKTDAFTRLGDSVWLMQGDCLERMKEIPDGSVDMVLTDPPYGTTECKWDSIIPLEPMWEQLKRIIKPNGVIALTASQPFTSILVTSNIKMFKHEWVWIKNRGSNFANTVREPMKEHEVVLVFSNGKWVYNKQMQERSGGGLERAKYSFNDKGVERETYRKFEGRVVERMPELRVPSSCQKFNVASGAEKTKHPTQKPVAFMEYLIRTYTNEGETVLDFTMGSGTTGVACSNLNRKFIGIEMDAGYFEIARSRINPARTALGDDDDEKLCKKKSKAEDDGEPVRKKKRKKSRPASD